MKYLKHESDPMPFQNQHIQHVVADPLDLYRRGREGARRMMKNRVCAGLLALATAIALVDGHAYLQFPISRQYSESADFHDPE